MRVLFFRAGKVFRVLAREIPSRIHDRHLIIWGARHTPRLATLPRSLHSGQLRPEQHQRERPRNRERQYSIPSHQERNGGASDSIQCGRQKLSRRGFRMEFHRSGMRLTLGRRHAPTQQLDSEIFPCPSPFLKPTARLAWLWSPRHRAPWAWRHPGPGWTCPGGA